MPRDVFSIQTQGSAKAAKSIHDTGTRANNIRPAASKIRTAYREAEAEIFRDNGGQQAWQKLKDSTKANKARLHKDPRILRMSGALYKSLTAPRAKYQVDEREAHEVAFGTTLPYAVFHEEGKGQAKRPTQAFTAAQLKRINDAIEEYVNTGDTGSGGGWF